MKHWTRDQKLLILGPAVLSLLLLTLFIGGLLPFEWPGLLLAIALLNVCGDMTYAVRNERRLRRGEELLHNDVIGDRATAAAAFRRESNRYRGVVELAGTRWGAVSCEPVAAGACVDVVGRRSLVLDVVPSESGKPREGVRAAGP